MFVRKGRAARTETEKLKDVRSNSTDAERECATPTVVAQEGDVEIITDGDEPQSVPHKVTQEPV